MGQFVVDWAQGELRSRGSRPRSGPEGGRLLPDRRAPQRREPRGLELVPMEHIVGVEWDEPASFSDP